MSGCTDYWQCLGCCDHSSSMHVYRVAGEMFDSSVDITLLLENQARGVYALKISTKLKWSLQNRNFSSNNVYTGNH